MKPVMTENGPAFAIHAADGKSMAIASSAQFAATAIISERYGAEPGALTGGVRGIRRLSADVTAVLNSTKSRLG